VGALRNFSSGKGGGEEEEGKHQTHRYYGKPYGAAPTCGRRTPEMGVSVMFFSKKT
jgi:hypothetical protein